MKKKRTSNGEAGLRSSGAQSRPRSWFAEFKENLFRPVDALPLGVFRFLFGLLLCIEFFVVSRNTFPDDYIKPLFHFTYPFFDLLGLKPLSQPSLWLVFHALRISAVGIMLGLLTRLSLIVFTSSYGYFFFMESTVYTNHYYLIFLISLLMCLGHSGTAFSLDSRFSRKSRRPEIAYWEVFLLRFQICVVFLFGGIAKMNADWLIHAAPLYLNLIEHFSLFGYPLHAKWIAVVLSWGGMMSDLGLGTLLALNRWPKLTFVWLCAFNGMNVFLFGWGIKTFPYLMISSYLLFLPAPIVRDFMARITNGYVSRNGPKLVKA